MNILHKLYSLEYDTTSKIVTFLWLTNVDNEQFRTINETMLEFVKEHKATKLVDAIHYGLEISPENQQWSAHDLIPRLYKAGLRYGAVVIPQNPETVNGVEAVVQELDPDQLVIKYFSTVIRAKLWLNDI